MGGSNEPPALHVCLQITWDRMELDVVKADKFITISESLTLIKNILRSDAHRYLPSSATKMTLNNLTTMVTTLGRSLLQAFQFGVDMAGNALDLLGHSAEADKRFLAAVHCHLTLGVEYLPAQLDDYPKTTTMMK